MLFSKDQKQNGKDKKQSLFGLLFSPQIGKEVAPIKESATMFVQMLALVFAMTGLFPKDHPALKDPKVRLTLFDVIRTAYGSLAFSREGIPQILVFLAVVGTLVVSCLFIVLFVLSLFSGSAHAQVFESQASADWADSWVEYLFAGEPMTQVGASSATDCGLQQALGKTLGFFSSAVLVLAGLLLLYHLMSMIIKTAQTGRPFEGANHVWAPMRLVFAIALLVPVASNVSNSSTCPITGYNSGQYLVMRIAKWGSALGSNGWEFFLTALAGNVGTNCAAGTSAPSCLGPMRNAAGIVHPLIIADACAKIANEYILDQEGPNTKVDVNTLLQTTWAPGPQYMGYKIYDSTVYGPEDYDYGYFGVENENATRFCGGYNVGEKPAAPYDQIYNAQKAVFQALLPRIDAFNNNYFMMAIEGVNAPGYETKVKQIKEDYIKLIDEFYNDFFNATVQSVSDADAQAKNLTTQSLDNDGFFKYGWLVAGSWFNVIARMQAQRAQAIQNSLPVPITPEMFQYLPDANNIERRNDGKALDGVQTATKKALLEYQKSLNSIQQFVLSDQPNTVLARSKLAEPTKGLLAQFLDSPNPIDLVIKLVDRMGEEAGFWNSSGTLAVAFGAGQNPIQEVTAFGQKSVSFGKALLVGAGAAALAGGVPVVGGIASFASGFLALMATLFLTIGFTLGFLVPLYPFYRFFFGSVKWIMTVFEAVVLIPLFALAHVNPGGDGLPGPKGMYGYQVAMQLLLRPILMVFGLIVGFLLFKATIVVLNFLFEIAAEGTGNLVGANAVFSHAVYSVMYAAFVFMLANQCFKTIGLFPQVGLSYLGLARPHEETIGETGVPSAWATAAAVKTFGGINDFSQKAGSSLSSRAIKKRELESADDAAKKLRAEQNEIEQIRHEELRNAVSGGTASNPGGGRPPSGNP